MRTLANVQPIEETYRLFKEAAKKTDLVKPTEGIQSNIRESTYNIISGNTERTYQDEVFENELVYATEQWAMEYSDTPVNKRNAWEKDEECIENELKLLNCFSWKSKLKKWLAQVWRKTFEGIVDDTYFDYHDVQQRVPEVKTLKDRKISLRIRNKLWIDLTHTVFYTLKRKLKEVSKEQQSRICLENEFKIYDPELVIASFRRLSLWILKRKFKYRQSFVLWNTNNTVDIDTYIDMQGNPLFESFVEFEVEHISDAEALIDLFGLDEHERLTNGSTWTFKHVWVDYETMSSAEWIALPVNVINNKDIVRV